MLIFNTMFPIDTNAGIEDLLLITRDWWVRSPHSTIAKKLEDNFSITESLTIEDEKQRFSLISLADESPALGGVRLVTIEDGKKWITEIVGIKSDNFWVSIKVYCESDNPLLEQPQAKKPHLFKLITDAFAIGFDGYVPTADKPIYIKPDEHKIALKIINDELKCSMPAIYVSCLADSTHCVNVERLAVTLFGMAHVFVEPSAKFSLELCEKTEDNVINGKIGIYWPQDDNVWEVDPEKFSSARQTEDHLYGILKNSLLGKSTLRECSWSHLQSAKNKRIVDELTARRSKAVDDCLAAFGEEIEQKSLEIQRLEHENAKLKSQLYSPTLFSKSQQRQHATCSEEPDLYPGEKSDILLEFIERNSDGLEPCRKKDVLKNYIETHPRQGTRDDIIEKLKSVFKDYTRMDKKKWRTLHSLGFSISEEGKHYKLTFCNDDRYVVAVSKTGSDHRTGSNTIRDILHKMF